MQAGIVGHEIERRGIFERLYLLLRLNGNEGRIRFVVSLLPVDPLVPFKKIELPAFPAFAQGAMQMARVLVFLDFIEYFRELGFRAFGMLPEQALDGMPQFVDGVVCHRNAFRGRRGGSWIAYAGEGSSAWCELLYVKTFELSRSRYAKAVAGFPPLVAGLSGEQNSVAVLRLLRPWNVMPGLVPGIHAQKPSPPSRFTCSGAAWMARDEPTAVRFESSKTLARRTPSPLVGEGRGGGSR